MARFVANLLQPTTKPRVLPAHIIAFTFTEKAAAELKGRIVTRCRESNPGMSGLAELFVGTIHAFCLDLLQTEVPKYQKYEVLNEVQQALLMDRCSKQSGLTAAQDLKGEALRRYIDTNLYISALSILREAKLRSNALRGNSIMAGLQAYTTLLQKKEYFDYSSILTETADVLARHTGLKKRLRARVRYVIVDEYQDVNPIQERIVQLLHSLGATICVVGDDDQTIYQWRGSDVRNILTFESRYPKPKRIRLEENFRSSPGIVEIARDFIQQNEERLPKAMKPTDTQKCERGDIVALGFDHPEQEAEHIASTIRSLRGVAFEEGKRKRGLSWSDMAILLRSVRNSAEPITDALKEAGIPYIVGGMNNLFSSPEAEACRQLFYFISGETDEKTLIDAWEAAELGVGRRTLAKAVARAKESRKALPRPSQKRWSFYSLQRQFLSFLEDIQLREESIPNGRGEIVFYNLGKFSQVISDFETIHFHSKPVDKYEAFCGFLRYRAGSAYPEGWQNNQFASPDAVHIMTVHQAKGMQWPVVFLPALVRNRFPCRKPGGRNVWHLLPKQGVYGQERFEGAIEDERRLFYVAITRAQKFLHLTWAPVPGNQQAQHVSEFWQQVASSKWVQHNAPNYAKRKRLSPTPKGSVANVVLTFSNLKYFFECPYQFKLRVLYGFNAPIHEAMGYGKSLHDCLHEVHSRAIQGNVPKAAEVPRLVETHLHTPYAFPTLRDRLEKSACDIVKNYLKDNQQLFDTIEFSEKAIEIDLGDGITVSGRIDLVRRIDTGETTIVDLKSNDRAQAESVSQIQLHIYALGYRELTGHRADYVEVYDLDGRKRSARRVDDGLLRGIAADVRAAADALRKGVLRKRPSKKRCGECDFRMVCSSGAKVV